MKPILHNGQEMPIGHLAPTSLRCDCSKIGRDLVVRAIFANHCYTKAFDPEAHTNEQIIHYDSPERPRVFCPVRHELSYGLPTLVAELPARKVHQTAQRRNYVYVVPLEVNWQAYEIYFMIQRAQKVEGCDLRLTIESAYPVLAPAVLPKRPNNIRFRLLAYKVFAGQEVRFAPR